jgi:ribonuclease HI
MKEVTIYTDGSCKGNPGPGGWASVLIYKSNKREISGAITETTNNRMELMAAIEALKALKEPCRVKLYSDSAYLINAINLGWLEKWLLNGWRTAKGKDVENQDLWKQILELGQIHSIEWVKVQGHAGDELNERCDQLAKQAIQTLKAS